jgi:hypothetical protein
MALRKGRPHVPPARRLIRKETLTTTCQFRCVNHAAQGARKPIMASTYRLRGNTGAAPLDQEIDALWYLVR